MSIAYGAVKTDSIELGFDYTGLRILTDNNPESYFRGENSEDAGNYQIEKLSRSIKR